MKKLGLILFAVLIARSLYSQDYIYQKDHIKIPAKVIEITPGFIKYKKFDHLDGPIYNIRIAEVFMIVYENGRRELFEQEEIVPKKPPQEVPTSEPPISIEPEPSPVETEQEKTSPKTKQKRDQEVRKPGVLIGITAGANMTTGIYTYKAGPEPPIESFRLAPMGGLLLDFPIANWLSLQSGIFYKGKGDRIDMGEWARTFEFPPGISISTTADGDGSIINQLGYLELSLVPTFLISNKRNGTQWMIGGGPYLGVALHGKEIMDFNIYYYRNGLLDEEDTNTVQKERPVEFVDVIPTDNDPEIKYINRFDYGVYFNLGIRFRTYIIGAQASYGLAFQEPSGDAIFGSVPTPTTKTQNLTGTLYIAFLLGKR